MKATNQKEKDSLLRQRTVLLRGEITDTTANEVIARVLYLQSLSQTDPIRMVIDSPGGSVSAGLAIVHTLEQVHPPVSTHCEKMACSMAAVILACGHPGSRSASPDAIVMFSMPEAADASKEADVDRFGSILISMVSQATNRSSDQIRSLFLHAEPLAAQTAADLGIIDRIGSC